MLFDSFSSDESHGSHLFLIEHVSRANRARTSRSAFLLARVLRFLLLLREGGIVWEGRLGSLRRFKDDVREVEKGYECGMNLEGFNDIKVGDLLETFVQEEVKQA